MESVLSEFQDVTIKSTFTEIFFGHINILWKIARAGQKKSWAGRNELIGASRLGFLTPVPFFKVVHKCPEVTVHFFHFIRTLNRAIRSTKNFETREYRNTLPTAWIWLVACSAVLSYSPSHFQVLTSENLIYD